MKRLVIFFLSGLVLSSCVTGGFDENPQLDARNEALAKAPKIENITINGTVLERNTQSIRVYNAHIGDVLNISADLTSGKDAELVNIEVWRQYYASEDPAPLDPTSEDGFLALNGNTNIYDLAYTVPAVDDDGADFHPGDVILVHMRVRNTLDNFGYRSFQIQIVE